VKIIIGSRVKIDGTRCKDLHRGSGFDDRASILRNLECEGYSDIAGTVDQPDLTNAAEVREFFRCERPECVFFVAGKSGGIVADIKSPATLILNNLVTACNVIDNATFDTSKPDGVAAKLLDSSVLAAMGWVPQTSLWSGPEATYAWYLETIRGLSHG
jgi:nucleoside-diphosphate-sugar epimerase